MKYQPFEKYVLRTPLFSFSQYQKLTSQDILSDDDLQAICKDPMLKEAIFLASPSLHQGLEKWLNNEPMEEKKSTRLKQSLLKYISRICARCTPFGLFAGCSVGQFNNVSQIELKSAKHHNRHTELDMNFLVALALKLAEIDTIKQQLKFFPNTSIYRVRGQLRYVEYAYVNNARQHHIASVDHSEYLQNILNKATEGALLKELAAEIVEEDISFEDAYGFVEELVDSQLLISELEPSISGDPFFEQIIKTLKRLNHTEEIVATLTQVVDQINLLDTQIGNSTEIYLSIEKLLSSLEVDFDERFLFQTDLIIQTESNTIEKSHAHEIKKAVSLIRKVSPPPKNTYLTSFRSAFYERFEEREVPLSIALDMETGIPYNRDFFTGEINPLVDDLVSQPKEKNREIDIKWNQVHQVLHQKILHAYKSGAYTISLLEADFEGIPLEENPLPDTFSIFTELVHVEGVQKMLLKFGGSASAATVLGRFCHGNKALHKHVKDIIEVERKSNPDAILAEILHLPESRVGNVLKRPTLRDFEIPYLSKSTQPLSQQLSIEDLTLSAPLNQKLVLRSKKHGKEVIPKLTNAHNFGYNALPIYQFLCDLQLQDVQAGLSFNYGPLDDAFEFLPRLEYHQTILHKATWNLTSTHIQEMVSLHHSPQKLLSATEKLRAKWQMPQYVMLADGDNHLLINLTNVSSIQMFLAEVKKRKKFQLVEFLFAENSVTKQEETFFTNEVIVSFYNQQKPHI
jgi:hypothetical protein